MKKDDLEIELRTQIIQFALLQHYKQYEHNKHGPDTFDCAGFVWHVYHEMLHINLYENGYGLSTTTKIMTSSIGKSILFEETNSLKEMEHIQNGDILFFHRQSLNEFEPKKDNKYPGHCGIYLENNIFIHCSRVKGKVVVSDFNKNEYWQKVLVGYKDVFADSCILERVMR